VVDAASAIALRKRGTMEDTLRNHAMGDPFNKATDTETALVATAEALEKGPPNAAKIQLVKAAHTKAFLKRGTAVNTRGALSKIAAKWTDKQLQKHQANLAAHALLLSDLNGAWNALTRVFASFIFAADTPINTPGKVLSAPEGSALARLVFFFVHVKAPALGQINLFFVCVDPEPWRACPLHVE
jgi:hypothetical protein